MHSVYRCDNFLSFKPTLVSSSLTNAVLVKRKRVIMLTGEAEQYDPGLVRSSNILPLHLKGRFGDPLR